MHAPGFYLHLEPRSCFAGGGLWHPDPAALTKVRDAIVARPKAWGAVVHGKTPTEGETLKRPPRGYDAGHPFVEDLKRKDFVVAIPFTEAQVCSPRFLSDYVDACRMASPLIEFLTRAIGLPW